jgi:hypothetical protein
MKKYLLSLLSVLLLIILILPQINAINISCFSFKTFDNNFLKYEDINYSSKIGGLGLDWAVGVDIDNQGSAYVTGITRSIRFPTKNAYDNSYNFGADVFVTKLSPSGKKIEYSTFIGGNDIDSGIMIKVDEEGFAYICGSSSSKNFPLINSIQDKNNGMSDIFILKLSPSGKELIYCTLIGGNDDDLARDLVLDENGCVYVTGRTKSKDFPIINGFDNTHNGTWDAFVVKISAEGNELLYSSYIGGVNDEWGYGIAIDDSKNVYLCGNTSSPDLPIKNAFDAENNNEDAYFMKINISQNELIYSSYLGGDEGEKGWNLDIDDEECIYICGRTNSPDFPVMNPIQKIKSNGWDAYITKISSEGDSLVYSTFIGGEGVEEEANRITIDQQGCAYSTGYTVSNDFPVMNPFDGEYGGKWDSFVIKLNPTGDKLLYSTYLGGRNSDDGYRVAVDNQGNFYATGWTESPSYPIKKSCFHRPGGFRDVYITKFSPNEYVPIQKIKGGFGFSVALNSNENPIDWSIGIKGNIFTSVLSNGTLKPYDYEIIKIRRKLGFGKINITISVNDIKKEYYAYMLGPLFLNIKEL